MKRIGYYLLPLILVMGWIQQSFADNSGNDDCANAEIISAMNNISGTTSATITGSLTSGTDKQDYYKFTVNTNGTVEINASNTSDNDTYDLDVGSTCSGTTCGTNFYNGSLSKTHNTSFAVSAGTTIYFKIAKNDSFNYSVSLRFIGSGNAAPVANNDTAETNATAPVTINVLANDTDSDGTLAPSSVTIVTSPTRGTTAINTTNGAITYTPVTFTGNDSFTYKVQDDDGAWSNTATVTITYPRPVAMDDDFVCPVSGSILNNIITNPPSDERSEDNLTMNSVNGTVYTTWPRTIATAHGSFVIQSDGNFTYTPTTGFTGEDSVTYTIKNGYNLTSNTATVMFYVNNYCAQARTLLSTDNTCTTDTNSTSGNVQSDEPDYYQIVLTQNGVLDVNLSNDSNSMHLYYDFGDNCVQLFNKNPDTTSVLDAEVPAVSASLPLNAGTYYLALKGDSRNNDTPYTVSVAFRSQCAGGPPIYPATYRSIGINDPGLDYEQNKSITTKIVNQTFGLQISYLDASGSVVAYNGTYGNTTLPLSVFLWTADDQCQNPVSLGMTQLVNTQSTVVATPLTIAAAARAKRIKTSAFDIAKYLNNANVLNCNRSSTQSGLCLLPACMNADHKILEVFPPALFPNVMTCVYGDGVGAAPCQSQSYYGHCGGSKGAITPDKYNNVYGCAMCLADAMGGDICSEDNFAIRPKNFGFNLTNPGSPNLLKSGDEHNITIHAYDALNADSLGYDQSSAQLSIAAIKRMPNNTINNDLNGTASFPNAFAFTNGLSSGANMTFDDVGKITVDLNDTNWSIVDADDTALVDRTVHGEGNFTFIPYQFKVSGPVRLVDSRDGNFTYYSNVANDVNMTMSAKFDLNVTSQNKQGNTTYNFDSASWEHAISAVPTVIDTLRGDANESNITNSTVGFAVGVKHLAWNDGNTSRVLKFNFPRDPSIPWDPAEVNAPEANLSISATYVDGAYSETPENNATNRSGATNGTIGNATFLYGRAEGPNYRFAQNAPVPSIATYGCGRIFFEFYNTVPANPLVTAVFGGTMPPMSLSPDAGWYVNPQHDTALDGNVSSIVMQPVTTHVAVYGHDVNVHSACAGAMSGGGFEKRVFEYDGFFGYPFKSTSILDATDWLDVTGNNFGIEFYKAGVWVGEQSGTTTAADRDAETITNRRINW